MGRGKPVLISFNEEFLGNLKAAAKLNGMKFSEFVRLSASLLAEKVYLEHGLKAPDLNGWHMEVGGDFSDARAAKDTNYKKRTNKKEEEK